MKYIKQSIVFISILLFTSCTDVIDVSVPYQGERLIIEASLDWQKGTPGNDQVIKLSALIPYFDTIETDKKIVTGASVKVTDDVDGTEIIFQDENDGTYTTQDFVPHLNRSYTLEIVYKDQTYIARETMTPVVPIANVVQGVEGGFDSEAIEVTVSFQDPADEENYYLIRYYEHGDLLPELDFESDEFTNGNIIDDFFEKESEDDQEAFVPGDIIDISLYGISKRYYNYIRLLIEQSEAGEEPFSALPVTLKGNCINITQPENTPYGYFRLVEMDHVTYTVQ